MARREGKGYKGRLAVAKTDRDSTAIANVSKLGVLIGQLAQRLGTAFAVLFFLVACVYLLGSEKTRDDFIREVLFGAVTGKRFLQWFFGGLVGIIVLGSGAVALVNKIGNNKEANRLRKTVDELQTRGLEQAKEIETIREVLTEEQKRQLMREQKLQLTDGGKS